MMFDQDDIQNGGEVRLDEFDLLFGLSILLSFLVLIYLLIK